MSWTGCQNNSIYLNFYLQKSLESFGKKSADKMWFDKNSRWKVPCPVLDRVKLVFQCSTYIFLSKVLRISKSTLWKAFHTQLINPLKILKSLCMKFVFWFFYKEYHNWSFVWIVHPYWLAPLHLAVTSRIPWW